MTDALIKRGTFEHGGAEGRPSEDAWPRRQTLGQHIPVPGNGPTISRVRPKLRDGPGAAVENHPIGVLISGLRPPGLCCGHGCVSLCSHDTELFLVKYQQLVV